MHTENIIRKNDSSYIRNYITRRKQNSIFKVLKSVNIETYKMPLRMNIQQDIRD